MKKALATALLSMGCACPICAQSSSAPGVQIYGLVDTGVEYIKGGGVHTTRLTSLSGGQSPSRLGFRGAEDLGGGLGAVFALEMGFGVDNGLPQQSGRSFGRQAYVGLATGWGTFSVGRQYTMTFYSMFDADVIGPAVFGAAALDPYLPQSRVDNSFAYRGTFGGLTLGATYSLGRDVAPPGNCPGETGGRACREWSAMVKYDTPGWGVALVHDELNGGASGNFFGQPVGTRPSVDNKDRRTILNGYVKFGDAKIGAGWIKRKLSAAPIPLSTDIYFVGINYVVYGSFSVDAQLLALKDARQDAGARMAVIRGNYGLSRRTSVYAMVGHVSNERNAAYSITASELTGVPPGAGRGQSGVMLGIRHSF
jgi:predicted porin